MTEPTLHEEKSKINTLKYYKTPGEDHINLDLMKLTSKQLIAEIYKFIYNVLTTEKYLQTKICQSSVRSKRETQQKAKTIEESYF